MNVGGKPAMNQNDREMYVGPRDLPQLSSQKDDYEARKKQEHLFTTGKFNDPDEERNDRSGIKSSQEKQSLGQFRSEERKRERQRESKDL